VILEGARTATISARKHMSNNDDDAELILRRHVGAVENDAVRLGFCCLRPQCGIRLARLARLTLDRG
jgi:hypothetical protein